MKRRRWCPVLASFLLALLVAAPVLAGGERRPKGETSGSSSRSQASPAQSTASPGNRPSPRVAVPRGDQPRSQPQRRPQPQRDRRPQDDDGRRSSIHRFHSSVPIYYGPYRWHPWGWWGSWYSPWWYYPWGPGVYWYTEQVRPDMGALDLDIRPEKARVYLDGAPIGVADNFDGWPRELWLEEGTYDLVFHHEGFETIARQYTIYPGVIIAVEDRMVPGEAKLPEDLLARSSANREERLRRRLERGEEPWEAGDADRMGWRDRVRAERAEAGREAPRDDGRQGAYDARVEPARLRLAVEPTDAAIYLDGRFLGTGDELLGAAASLMVDPGDHELEVVRPGYESKTTTFTAEAGEEVELTVELVRRAAAGI